MKNTSDLSFGKYLLNAMKKNNLSRAKLIRALNDNNFGKEHKVAIFRVINDKIGKTQLDEITKKLYNLRINGKPLKLFEEKDRLTIDRACQITLKGAENYVSDNLIKNVFLDSKNENPTETGVFYQYLKKFDSISEMLLINIQTENILNDFYIFLKEASQNIEVYHLINLYETVSKTINVFSKILKLLPYHKNYIPYTFELSESSQLNNLFDKIYIKTDDGIIIYKDGIAAEIKVTDSIYEFIENEYTQTKTLMKNNFEKIFVEYFKDSFEKVFPQAIKSASGCYQSTNISESSYSYQICLGNLFIIIPEILSEKIRHAALGSKTIEEYDEKVEQVNRKLSEYNMLENPLFTGTILNDDNIMFDMNLYFTVKGLEEFTNSCKPYGYEIVNDIFSESSNLNKNEMKLILQKIGTYIKNNQNKNSKIKVHIIDNDEKRNQDLEYFDFPEKFNLSIINSKYLLIEHFAKNDYWMLNLTGCQKLQDIFHEFLNELLKIYCLSNEKSLDFLNELLIKFN